MYVTACLVNCTINTGTFRRPRMVIKDLDTPTYDYKSCSDITTFASISINHYKYTYLVSVYPSAPSYRAVYLINRQPNCSNGRDTCQYWLFKIIHDSSWEKDLSYSAKWFTSGTTREAVRKPGRGCLLVWVNDDTMPWKLLCSLKTKDEESDTWIQGKRNSHVI